MQNLVAFVPTFIKPLEAFSRGLRNLKDDESQSDGPQIATFAINLTLYNVERLTVYQTRLLHLCCRLFQGKITSAPLVLESI